MSAKRLPFTPFALTVLIALPILAASASAATEKVLHSFNPVRHGSQPSANLSVDANGNLYGTADIGGDSEMGAVYKLSPDSNGGWTQIVLYSFKGGTDGAYPINSGVIFDAAGNMYGTTRQGGTGDCHGPTCGTVFELSPNSHGGWTERILYIFQGLSDGGVPSAGLVFDSSGNLYGTTNLGGEQANSSGTVFKLTPHSDGHWTQRVIYRFSGGYDGSTPEASVVFDAAGNLYGTTASGGTYYSGNVFKLTPSSQGEWAESVLYSFAGHADGSLPYSPLIFDSSGNLYGTTQYGGGSAGCVGGCGTVFELKPNGNGNWTENILYSFKGGTGDGAAPQAGLTLDQAGNLYGTTTIGGIDGCRYLIGCGVVFQLTPSSGGQWAESILYSFAGGYDGGNPYLDTGVIFDQKGNLYGTTGSGGTANLGTIFEVKPSAGGVWKKGTIYTFKGDDGSQPIAGLVFDPAGNLYGATSSGGTYENGAVFKLTRNGNGGWTGSLIYSFKGTPDGANPFGTLNFDAAGNLYGTTLYGGSGKCPPYSGCGTVFELTPSSGAEWTESLLHSFAGGTDGINPFAGLAWDKQGNLVGTTYYGGGNNCYGVVGCGTVFELTPSSGGDWAESVLYRFTGGADNGEPYLGSLIVDAAGNLYGTTSYTGCDGCTGFWGTVFELSANGVGGWTLKVLFTFTDGEVPMSGLTLDAAGNLHGTTYYSQFGGPAYGAVFELKQSGGVWTESTLYGFGSDGEFPLAGVTFDAAGNLYGTTSEGGASCSFYYYTCGVVYELTPGSGGQWTYNVLHAFNGSPSDGGDPYAGVVLDGAGNLYGTTYAGGPAGYYGTVFEVTP